MLKSYSNPILPWKQSFWTPQIRSPGHQWRRDRLGGRCFHIGAGGVLTAEFWLHREKCRLPPKKKEREREKESRQISPNVIIWHPTSTKIHQTLVFNSETWQPGGLRSGWDVFFTRSDNLPKLCFSVLVAYVLNHVTLWLCQNSYWKWPIEIVDLPIQNGDFQ